MTRGGAAVAAACAACVAMLLTAGCGPPEGTTVAVGSQRFSVEVADSSSERLQGLSGRASVPAGTGMLFTYDRPAPLGYWMSGMQVPIDLAWISGDRVIEIVTLQPCRAAGPCPTESSPGPVDAVLEVAAGALTGVAAGDPVVVSGG